MDFYVNMERWKHRDEYGTGIFVRALVDGKYESADISTLTKQSLFDFLRSRGGENIWAEDVVGIILGYGNF